MRVLVVDDEPAMLETYRTVFASVAVDDDDDDLASMAAALFPDAARSDGDAPLAEAVFDVTYAAGGAEAVELVAQSIADGRPFEVAFLDMRMPPGIDGKETARQIRQLDQGINLVMVTGYSDHRPVEVAKVAGPLSKLYYVAKPFEVEEILQLARALAEKWCSEQALEEARRALARQVELLEEANIGLRASEARALHAAFHDGLTGAPNRAAFLKELTGLIGDRHADFMAAILDLDRFKNVNDSLGHAAGDELICRVYQRLVGVLPEHSFCARLGGDEFGIIMPFRDAERALAVAAELVRACSETHTIFGQSVIVGASAGVAEPLDGGERNAIDVIRRADLALYAAKRAGRGQARLFDQGLDESARLRQRIESGLRRAIAEDELSLVFQPIVGQAGHDIVGFEALVRWESPEHGVMAPSLFVPIAEEGDLIHGLSEWVVPRALEACRHWPSQYVSLNLSPRQFRHPGLVGYLQEQIDRVGLPAGRVQIEITETALFDDPASAASTLERLRTLGFRIALDDFGTGYSSLVNIKNFSIDCIKIDRAFVTALATEANSSAIVASITQLARSLGMTVVAEGVEDRFQHSTLRAAGCSHMQGYLFGRPMSEASAQSRADGRVPGEPMHGSA
jgi:diguanylate cyclase (GGDEF)-like protein